MKRARLQSAPSHLRDTALPYRSQNAENHDYAPYRESAMTAVDSWRSVPFLYLFSTSHPLSVPILYLLCTLSVPRIRHQYLSCTLCVPCQYLTGIWHQYLSCTSCVPFQYLASGISTFSVPFVYPSSRCASWSLDRDAFSVPRGP